MSYVESKAVIRAEIKHLCGATFEQAYQYFFHRLGDANEVDEYGGTIEWFSYKEEVGKCHPVYRRERDGVMRWGVDFLLTHSGYDGYLGYTGTLDDLHRAMRKLTCQFDDDIDIEDMKFCVYSWYNGGDEPIHFK